MKITPLPDISGKWKGHDEQSSFGRPARAIITCNFEKVGKAFEGAISFTPIGIEDSIYLPEPATTFQAKLRAEWHGGKILKLEWFNPNSDFIFCGSACFELTHNGEKLAGHFVGFGPRSHAIVNGPIMLVRE
ncbi:MAG: hypothetical protein AAF694_08965 [Bacteroidota bacterium]